MEFVFVVPRQDLFLDCTPHGLQLFQGGSSSEPLNQPVSYSADSEKSVEEGEQGNEELKFQELVQRCGFFVEREYAERSPGLKQVIPYTIVYLSLIHI